MEEVVKIRFKRLRDMKLSVKLIATFILVAVIAAIVGTVGIANLIRANNNSNDLFWQNTMGIVYSEDAYASVLHLRYNAWKFTVANTLDAEAECIEVIDELCGEIDSLLLKYNDTIQSDENSIEYQNLCDNWEQYRSYIQKLVNSAGGGGRIVKEAILSESDEVVDKLIDNFINLVENNTKNAQQREAENTASAKTASIVMIIIIAIGVIIAIALGLIMTEVIGQPIKYMVTVADRIALGDVKAENRVRRKDEIGKLADSFRKMIENIRKQAFAVESVADGDLTVQVPISSSDDLLGNKLAEMVKKNGDMLSNIYASSEQVAIGSKQLSDSSIVLSRGATEQSSAIEELTASIEEISSQTEQNAQYANKANDLAKEAMINAEKGSSQMKDMLKAMDEINESSSNVSKIIKVIEDIAFQTNILALNAAVEAARAGQHGKGFAVVAEEVRNLAARSANAAKETTDMIEGSIRKSEDGTKIARETAQALDSIVNAIEEVANLVHDITTSSNEQALGLRQISQGIVQVADVVRSNTATSEEIAAASEELTRQALLLKEAVSQYKFKKNTYSQPQSFEAIDILDSLEETQSSDTASKPKIELSDSEFGKY
ncbi:MAG TPA: methyl-accepting chemotaxis protein [Clostridiales bacterium]|nr:methyl-accepting chemotaxis protein [Clostridiales bacterium]